MKELKCKRCDCYLGEIEKGKVKNGTVFLCTDCYKLIEDLLSYNRDSKQNYDMPDFLKGLFK